MTKDEPKGVACCGKTTPFSAWVYAHWDERIEFTCPTCGKRFSVLRGKYREIKKGGAK